MTVLGMVGLSLWSMRVNRRWYSPDDVRPPGAGWANVTDAVRVAASSEPVTAVDADVVCVGVFTGEAPALAEAAGLVARGEARATARHLAVAHLGTRPLIVAGLGPRDRFDGEVARGVAGVVRRRATELSARSVVWALPEDAGPQIAEALVAGTVLGAYRYTRYRAAPAEPELEALTIADAPGLQDAVARAGVLAAAQNRARELGNAPPNELTPTAVAGYAAKLAARYPSLTCELADEDEIRARKMGAFAAVAAGSAEPAALITLTYEPAGVAPDRPRLALIGKAVTFDSGGLNLKPGPSLIGMKFDMGGGAAVIETVAALAELAAPVRLLAVVGATENMTGPAAMRIGDILTASDGTTIEMNNADAEGRLVLADCIAHARRLGCEAIVDVATLTGAVVTALGSTYAGFMSSDDELAERVVQAGRRTGELVWRLPLHPAYAEMTKGRDAQLTNRPEPRGVAAAITAAEFLHHFAGDVPWAHLDIAGVADDVKTPYFDKGATGFGVRLLTELALGY